MSLPLFQSLDMLAVPIKSGFCYKIKNLSRKAQALIEGTSLFSHTPKASVYGRGYVNENRYRAISDMFASAITTERRSQLQVETICLEKKSPTSRLRRKLCKLF
eukprot:TRINITY_DN5961_c0_g1_i1.p2 TRINITY_DN5961_c0_g1~~TRINITY_DN5961_c0_g1_i1.p2  ORF type:complete len:104 (-),score=8.95 TRINITY_DN5961_c0_g1_i1:315-626(-)